MILIYKRISFLNSKKQKNKNKKNKQTKNYQVAEVVPAYVRMFSSNLIVVTETKLCLISLCFLPVCKQKMHYTWKTPVDDTWISFG